MRLSGVASCTIISCNISGTVFLCLTRARRPAAEAGGEGARGRALGFVFFATAVGAVASPGLLGPSGDLAQAFGLPPLTGLYVVAILCFTAAALLLAAASNPAVPYLRRSAGLLGPSPGRRPTRGEVALGLKAPSVCLAVAILAATNCVWSTIRAARSPNRPC